MKLESWLARTKALLSRPLERAVARGIRPLMERFEATLARQIEQSEARQHQLSTRVISRLEGIEGEAAASRRGIEALAERQDEAVEGLGRSLERLEGQPSR